MCSNVTNVTSHATLTLLRAARVSRRAAASAADRWLLLIYRVPQDPPGRRTYVWRQLKQLGAVYLQQAAAVLPDRPALRAALEALAERIRTQAGEVSLLETTSPSPDWARDLAQRFNRARDEEYAELLETVARFEDELRRESGRGKFTFAELEENEADWEKLQRWRQRIAARDFFGAAGRAEADAALERGRQALAVFTDAVYRHEDVQAGGDGDGPPATAGGLPPTTQREDTSDGSRPSARVRVS